MDLGNPFCDRGYTPIERTQVVVNKDAAKAVLQRIYDCYVNNKKKYSEAKSRQRVLTQNCMRDICEIIGKPMPRMKATDADAQEII